MRDTIQVNDDYPFPTGKSCYEAHYTLVLKMHTQNMAASGPGVLILQGNNVIQVQSSEDPENIARCMSLSESREIISSMYRHACKM
jgi:hypothetical protein